MSLTISLLNDFNYILSVHFLQESNQHVHRKWSVTTGDDPVR